MADIAVKVLVVYPVYVDCVISDIESEAQLKDKVLEKAKSYLDQGGITPLITDSETHPELIDA